MEYISLQEASEKLGVTDRYLRKLCTENKIDGAHKDGKSWQIPKDYLTKDKPKISIVLGGAFGEGLECAIYLLEQGHKVAVLDKSANNIEKAKRRISQNYIERCSFFCVDTSDEETMKKIAEELNIYLIDILIMNAGTPIIDKAEFNNKERIDIVLSGYVYGNIIAMSTFYPMMKDTVVVALMQKKAAKLGLPNETLYNAAMHGLDGFIDCIKQACENEKISVLKVYSGSIDSSFWDEEAIYMPIAKPKRLIPARELAEIIVDTAKINKKYNISEIHIERTKSWTR